MGTKTPKDELKVRKIGGQLKSCYYTFRNSVESVNENIIPFFISLGFTLKDEDRIIDALLANSLKGAIKQTYIELTTEKVKAGKIPLEKILSKVTLKERDETPEEREKRIDREIHRKLVYHYKEIESKFSKYLYYGIPYYNRASFEILREALYLTPTGLSIDVDKYIKIFGDYLEAKGSTTYEEHQRVADTINHFFNGAVEITQNELERYFTIEGGVVKPNPSSITKEDYIRLGYKGKTTIMKRNGN